ncbi:EAL domain, c-di-GMP-specific phosphodiesterase class I (or its enzymatically inactive variant) [Aeromonas sp. RU39B]|uniref:EAL domain-containing protein n=1 Tax=Aeromonas sp. RU39B TaxID=1907416 RepID=UPI000954CDF9|nr:EAL domain-containing protein [Aeromonas sp. RU39B]SIR27614.1 EAL domain, c-di-GMP-specific phosphodiesterase class I (or its enzymatically inactive variant) [Aeromonas sp. RU39B]
MGIPSAPPLPVCQQCQEQGELDFDFTMAFQPIVDCQASTIFGYEALVRGLNNESAHSVIAHVTDDNRYRFDQLCRIKAIALAAKLELKGMLSINFLPNAVYRPERCIRTTLQAAREHRFPIEQIMFEFTEVEQVLDGQHVRKIVDHYRTLGFKTAIDDFGAGYSGLNLLTDFRPDIIKLDMHLLRGIDQDTTRQAIVRHCLALFAELNITALAEGIETRSEMACLRKMGVRLMQGYLFAKPGFESLPDVDFASL